MNLRMKLLVVPSMLVASILGACGPQDGQQGDIDLNTPVAPAIEEAQGVETPVVAEEEAQVTEPTTVAPAEEQAGAEATTVAPAEEEAAVTEPTTAAPAEEQAGAEATTVAPAEEQAGAEATTVAPAEEEASVEATTVAPAEEEAGVTDETTPDVGQFDMLSAVKASEIIGYGVKNAQDEDLGEIEDVLVDINNSQAKYAVLSFGGFLDIGDKLFAIPIDAIHFNPDEQAFMFDVTEEKLAEAPGFPRDNWPDTTVPDWDMDFRDYWVTEGQDTLENPEVVETGQVLRASEILDYGLHDAQEAEIGEVEDLIVEMHEPHLAFAVVTLQPMDDTTQEERFYAVPLNNLQLDTPGDEFFVFNIDQQALDTALSFSPDEWDNQMNLEEDVN